MSKASSSKLLQLGSVLYTGKAIKSGAHVTLTPVILTKTSLQARSYSKRYQRMTKRRGAGADAVDDKEFEELKQEEEKEQAEKREEGDQRQIEKEEEEVSDEQLLQEKWDITKMPEEEVRAMWDPEGDVISKRMEVILKRQKRAGDIYDNNPQLYGTGAARVEASANQVSEEEMKAINEEEEFEEGEEEEAVAEQMEQEMAEEEEEDGIDELDEDFEHAAIEGHRRHFNEEEAGSLHVADITTDSMLEKRLDFLEEIEADESGEAAEPAQEELAENEEAVELLESLKALSAQNGISAELTPAELAETQRQVDAMVETMIEPEEEAEEEEDMETYRARNPVDVTGFLAPDELEYAGRYASEAGLLIKAEPEEAEQFMKDLKSGSGEVPPEVEAILARNTKPNTIDLDPTNIDQLRQWASKLEEDVLKAEDTEATTEQTTAKSTGVAAQVLEFERQLGMTPDLLEKEEQERQRLSGKLLNLENNPIFTQVPQQPFKNVEEDAYRAYLAKRGQQYIDHNLLDYDPSLIFQTFAKGQQQPSYPPGAGIRDEKERLKSIGADFAAISAAPSPLPEFTLEEKMQLFGEAQEFRSEKYVDQPNRNYQHLFSSQAPERIELEDARKMYIISQSDHASYFQGGFGGSLDKVFESLNQRALLIRYQVLPVIEHLKKVRAHVLQQKPLEDNKRGFIFTGVRGGGKSSLLSIATHYAFKNNFLVFHIPNGFWWTNGKHYVEPSTLIRGYFHCPMAEERFMKAFQSANTAFLQNHPLSKDYDLPLETGQKQPRTLFDLINYGLAQYTNRTIAFKLLMDEIALIKHVPILFAIDDYNFLTDETAFSFGDIKNFQTVTPKKVHSDKYILMRGLNKILHDNASNVIFLCAEAKRWPAKTPRTLDFYSLFDVVNVPRYTQQEMKTICDYYTSVYWSFSRPDTYLDNLTFMTGAVGERVWKSMQTF